MSDQTNNKATKSTRLARPMVCLVTALLAANPARSQQAAAPTQTGTPSQPLPASTYVIPAMPGQLLGMLLAHGNRLTTPGNERTTLTGNFARGAGASSATVITQLPGMVRITLSGAESKTLLFDGSNATSNGVAASGADLDLLESFQGDTVENFFYSYGKTSGARFLGARFRMDGQTTPGYTGPWYDIFELLQPVAVRGGVAKQQKYYYFDSTTARFSKARYRVRRNGNAVEVQTVYSGWTKNNGQLLPGKIERLENGTSVFSFTVTGMQLSPGVQDATFTSTGAVTP